jgi:hypothetical protein
LIALRRQSRTRAGGVGARNGYDETPRVWACFVGKYGRRRRLGFEDRA